MKILSFKHLTSVDCQHFAEVTVGPEFRIIGSKEPTTHVIFKTKFNPYDTYWANPWRWLSDGSKCPPEVTEMEQALEARERFLKKS